MIDWTRIIEATIVVIPQIMAIWLQRRNAAVLLKVEANVNHLTDQRVAVQALASHAEGKAEGVAQERLRTGDKR